MPGPVSPMLALFWDTDHDSTLALETNLCHAFAFPEHLPSDNDTPFVTKTTSSSSPSPRPHTLAMQFG